MNKIEREIYENLINHLYYTVNKKINTVISISRPKTWPSKYYKEIDVKNTLSQNNK